MYFFFVEIKCICGFFAHHYAFLSNGSGISELSVPRHSACVECFAAAVFGDCRVCCCKHIPVCKAAVHLPRSTHQAHGAAGDLHFPRIWRLLVCVAANSRAKPVQNGDCEFIKVKKCHKLFKLVVASDVFINREGPVCGGWGVLVCAIGENGKGAGPAQIL